MALSGILEIVSERHEKIEVSSLVGTYIPSFSFIGPVVSEKKIFNTDSWKQGVS